MPDNKTVQLELDHFKRSVEITRDIRFQANLRLLRRQKWSSYMISSLSLYVITLSLLPNLLILDKFETQLLLAASIVLSIFIIFTSLIDGSQNFYHNGELFLTSAKRIERIHRDLKGLDIEASPEKSREELKNLKHNYNQALDECSIGHESTDLYREKASTPKLFPDNYPPNKSKTFIQIRYWILAIYLEYSWLIPHVLALSIISFITYDFVLRSAPPLRP